MNNNRLRILNECLENIQEAYDELEGVRDDEEDAYDNLPEGFQCGERGDLMQEAIDNLDEALEHLDNVTSNLEEVVSTAESLMVIKIDIDEAWRKLKEGDMVTHKTFGEGEILKIEDDFYFIKFKEKTSKFIFPYAIEKGFITF